MTRITINPLPIELGLNEEQYKLVKRDLEEQGHTVRFQAPVIERSAPDVTQTLRAAYDVMLYLADFVDDRALHAIADVLILRLVSRRRRNQHRVAAIYGPDGRTVLLKVDLPNEEPADEE